MVARESQNGSPGTRRTFKFEAQVRTSLSHTCLAGSSRPGLVQKRCMHVPTSQFQLAHKLHFAQLESLIDNNPADLRLELDVHKLGERFDVALCFGILHRVTDPIALLRALVSVLTPRGEIVLETYGSRLPADIPAIEVHAPGDV